MDNTSDVPAAATDCRLPSWFRGVTDVFAYTSYLVISPIYTILSTGGFLFMLVLMAKQTRDDRAYFYQLFLTVAQALEAWTLSLCIFCNYWAGLDTPGQLWFQQTYILMFYQAHLGIPFNQVPMYSSLYLAISMSIDRLFALVRPIEYKSIDRRRHQYAALIVSILIGIASCTHNAFLFKIGTAGDNKYFPEFNVEFGLSRLGTVMTGVANFVRIFGLVLLVGSNILLIRLFRQRTSKVNMMVADSRDIKGRERRKKERTLLILTLCESTFCAVKQVSEIVFFSFTFTNNWPCYDDLGVPILNFFLQLASLADVFMPFIVSKHMRDMAVASLPGGVRDLFTAQNSLQSGPGKSGGLNA